MGLFGGRAYDGVSVDDLVSYLGVHRNSLYKALGSKRGLYLIALRHHLAADVRPLLDALADATDAAAALRLVTSADLDLLLLAAIERAPVGPRRRCPDRERHLRRPQRRAVGPGLDRGCLRLHPRARLRPEPVH
ncbi:TetR family transcriptional regulator [Streptomyces prasinus]|uniref:TetR family transcriptional regulator n=1 Tax=Streptomyces prasinus TaxID=67345 RepID=UPI00368C7343